MFALAGLGARRASGHGWQAPSPDGEEGRRRKRLTCGSCNAVREEGKWQRVGVVAERAFVWAERCAELGHGARARGGKEGHWVGLQSGPHCWAACTRGKGKRRHGAGPPMALGRNGVWVMKRK